MLISLNLSKKKRSVRVLPALTCEDLARLSEVKMTKRNLLGLTNSFGDFLGMAVPFTIRFRLLMKNLFDKEFPLLWDDVLPEQENIYGLSLFPKLLCLEITFFHIVLDLLKQ